MKKLIAALLILTTINQSAFACLWDYDTLAMERAQFPGTLELITGKFLRHSEAFYQWRIEDRLKRLKSEPNNQQLIDDLAVAYDKTGQHQKAIDLMLSSKETNPDRYETAANLGTFYIHAGELEKGVEEIKRALAINPEAHFGREEYQMLLVEYMLEKRADPNPDRQDFWARATFPKYLLMKKFGDVNLRSKEAHQEITNATKGIQGMIRFGNHDSPILLESLGELLVHFEDPIDRQQRLAARAFLKASFESESEEERNRLRIKAQGNLHWQTREPNSQEDLPLSQIELALKSELEDAEQWYSKVVEDEKLWIAEGKDVDAEFSKKYYEEPSIPFETASTFPSTKIQIFLAGALLAIVFYYIRHPKTKLALKRRLNAG